jgi:lysozyme
MNLIPRARPQQSREQTEKILATHGVTTPVALLGVRGYYRDSMGKPDVNDRGLYDDAIFLVAPGKYLAFNANTDPSTYRERIANLAPGVWQYKVGIHGLSKPASQQYTALVQAEPVTVIRDGVGRDTGLFGINIHRGGYSGTSSLGCQTIIPEQWPQFIEQVVIALKSAGQKVIPYCLVETA